jgi:tRNA1(Val) A37 N6-methylase TrmN6
MQPPNPLQTLLERERQEFVRARRAQIFTPVPVARWLARWALHGLEPGAAVLDPAAGTGRLLAAVRERDPRAQLHAIEREPGAAEVLARALPAACLRVDDSLGCSLPQADAVVLNPPYGNADQLGAEAHAALADRWPFHRRQLDLSVLFVAAAVEALRPGGRLAAIVPRYWLEATGAAGFRGWLAERARLEWVIDLGNVQPFPDADVLSVLIVAVAGESGPARFARLESREALERVLGGGEPPRSYTVEVLGAGPWSQRSPEVEAALSRLESAGARVGDFFDVGQGIKTGLNRAFVLDDAQAGRLADAGADVRRLARPRDLHAGGIAPSGRWLLRSMSTDPEPVGAVGAWLEPFRVQLESRYQVRDGSVPWYALAIAQNLRLLEAAPKLLHPLYAREPRFAVDEVGHHVLTGAYALVPKRELPVALPEVAVWLNGPRVRGWAEARCKLKRDGYREFGRRALLEVPVPWSV